jgi:hypothetical protein
MTTMTICKRDTGDPLVRMFLDRYKINLLTVPRERVACGDVYIRNGRRVSSGVRVAELVEPAVTLPPVFEGEALADLAGTLSDGVSVDIGFGLLEGFLAAIGAGGVVSKVSAGVERSRTSTLRFRFTEATRDSIDGGALGTMLEGRRLRPTQPLVQEGNDYFVTTAVIRTPSLSLVGEDKKRQRTELGAEVMAIGEGHAGVTVERGDAGEVTFRGRKALAIGVELYELREGGEDGRVTMLPQDSGDPVKAFKERPPKPAFVAPDDEALLALDEGVPAKT